MKKLLRLLLVMIFTISLAESSFGQAKSRPSNSSIATPVKVKAKKKGQKAKGAKRIRKGSKKKASALQKADRRYVFFCKREDENEA
jgi:hypothetical protein